MMAPTVVLGADGAPELVLGSAGSNRIRSALFT
jgi:gamma-glutamyltranspeptidase